MQLISFDYKEDKKQPYKIDYSSLRFQWLNDYIEKADTVDLAMSKYYYGNEITVLRIHCGDDVLELAIRYYAGITEDEKEYAIHLCAYEENEMALRTARVRKSDDRLTVGDFTVEPLVRQQKIKF